MFRGPCSNEVLFSYYFKCIPNKNKPLHLKKLIGLYVVLKIIICYENYVIKLACITGEYDFRRKC